MLFIMAMALTTTITNALDISLDNTISLEQGTDCQKGAVYRLGTETKYNGKAIDLLLEIMNEDNEYHTLMNKACLNVADGILNTFLRDNDEGDNRAFMDFKISPVAKGTTTSLPVDRITLVGFDLDSTGTATTDTDDIYMKSPTKGYVNSTVSHVTYMEGDFGDGYNIRLKGQSSGDCSDSAGAPDPTCRGGGIASFGTEGANKVDYVYLRVQNDNAYGEESAESKSARLIQISFKKLDIIPILNGTDYGDLPASYGEASHKISIATVLGYGDVADDDSNKEHHSINADADDNASSGSKGNFDDEDAVSIENQEANTSTFFMKIGDTYTFNIGTSGNGYLNAWIDFNGDGDFDDDGEKILDEKAINSKLAMNTAVE
ncbi:MAG: hypothetical protein DSZ08_03425, partial [Sulfurovum sp.]